jgi:Ni/Co efflux regulator RcnB
MKKLITGALAALTLAGGSAAMGEAAQAQPHFGPQPYAQDHRDLGRDGYRQAPPRWSRGQHVPRSYRSHSRFIDYRREHLRAPPRGYGWVRGDSNQYLMIALTTGLIAAIASSH